MLQRIQREHRHWMNHNFPERDAYWLLLGVVEEVGELAHSHLKRIQGIRHTQQELDEMARDAVGDIAIFLIGYCSEMGWDFAEILDSVWPEVAKRDWKADNGIGDSDSR